MESQHSQVSLFSGSDAGSSLELFSQPPPPTDSAISTSASAASCSAELTNSSKSNHGDTSSQPPMQAGGRKYYTKYLSLAKEAGSVAGDASVLNNVDSVSSKMGFEAWKDKQQSNLERKQVLKDMAAAINEMTSKVNENISVLRDEVKTSMDTYAEDSSARWEKQTFSVLTQVLRGQEESRQMVQEIRDELTHQRSLLTCLSKKLFTDIADSSSTLIEVIEGVRNTFQRAAVSVASVSTQTFTAPETSKLQHNMAADQAVPTVSTVAVCNEASLYGDGNKPSTECSKSLPTSCISHTDRDQPQEGECPCTLDVCEKQLNTQMSQVHLVQRTDSKAKDERVLTGGRRTGGKRKSEERFPATTKVPCRAGKKTRWKVKPDTASTASRRSSRATKRPVKYTDSSSDDLATCNEFPPLHNGSVLHRNCSTIRRRVSVKQADRISSQTCENSIIKESPVNALSDALYSQTSSDISSRSIRAVSPITTQTDPKEKFQRRNEAAKRRKMVISSLSDPDLLLREIQDCILNGVDASDPSP